MAISKVILNGETLMDVTQDTVAANKLLSGETAHKNDGTAVTGNIATKTSSNLTVSGATVTAPAGYYASAASKSVASGTAGTPTATKSAVSNHAVTVTPSVTNTTGYISGGTKSGTAVSVSALELVAGTTLVADDSGDWYVANAETLTIPSGTAGTPTATKGAVSNHSVTVTPSVTNSGGWISSGTKTGTAVSVSASELVSGSQTITQNGTVDVTNFAEVVVDIDTSPKYTATISGTGSGMYTYVEHDSATYYTDGDSFEFAEGDTILLRAGGQRAGGSIVIDGVTVANDSWYRVSYNYSAPASDITISLEYSSQGSVIVETQSSESITVEPLSVTTNGTYTAPSGTAYSPVTVNVPTSGGGDGTGGNMSDPIRFFDYDGTLVASYTSVPSVLPSVPTHSGLKDGTWNYTLAQVTTQFNAMGTCDVGANYMTQSEDTEIDVVMQEGRLSPILTIAVNGTVTVDWGDNTSVDTATGASLTTRQAVPHTYASAGSYTIKIHVVSGSFTFYGSSSYSILRKNDTGNENRVYANCIRNIRLGSGVTNIGNYAFTNCYSLVSVTIPSSVTSIGTYTFNNCYSLVSVTIPSGVTSIGNSAFNYCYSLISVTIPSSVTSIVNSAFISCYSLASITIPSGVTSIGNSAFSYCFTIASITIPSGVTSIGTSAFNGCYSLVSVTIPSGITSIGNSAFSGCYGVAEYHFTATTPPTLGTTAFNSIVSDCTIYVPSSSLEAYQTAANWSSYASYMVGE